MDVAGDAACREASEQTGRETEIGLVDQLAVRLKRIGAVSDTVEHGLRADGVEQLVQVAVDEQIDQFDRVLRRSSRRQAGLREVVPNTSGRTVRSDRSRLAPTKPLAPRIRIGPWS